MNSSKQAVGETQEPDLWPVRFLRVQHVKPTSLKLERKYETLEYPPMTRCSYLPLDREKCFPDRKQIEMSSFFLFILSAPTARAEN